MVQYQCSDLRVNINLYWELPMSDIREREWIESLIESAVDESSREIAESALRAHISESERESRLDWEADELVWPDPKKISRGRGDLPTDRKGGGLIIYAGGVPGV